MSRYFKSHGLFHQLHLITKCSICLKQYWKVTVSRASRHSQAANQSGRAAAAETRRTRTITQQPADERLAVMSSLCSQIYVSLISRLAVAAPLPAHRPLTVTAPPRPAKPRGQAQGPASRCSGQPPRRAPLSPLAPLFNFKVEVGPGSFHGKRWRVLNR